MYLRNDLETRDRGDGDLFNGALQSFVTAAELDLGLDIHYLVDITLVDYKNQKIKFILGYSGYIVNIEVF